MDENIKKEIRKAAEQQDILVREARREALTRLEESARTVEDFRGIIGDWWDKLDDNRERNERRNEYLLNDEMFDWNLHVGDNFIDKFCMNPQDMHNLVEDSDLSRLIKNATDKQKTVFFPYVFRCRSTTKISECYCMTDRNVRKLCGLMRDNIRREMALVLQKRESLTIEQRDFLASYTPK